MVFINCEAKVLLLQGNYIFILKQIANHEISHKEADTCLLDIGKYHIGLVLLHQREVTNLQMYVSENATISKRDFEEIIQKCSPTCKNNIVAIHNATFTLVPTSVVNNDVLDDYVTPFIDVEKNEILIQHKLSNGCTSIASIKKATKEMIDSRFTDATIVNTSANLLNSYTFNLTTNKIYHGFIALHIDGFSLTIYKNFTCELHTMYLSNALEDILYYVANACTQLTINTDEIALQIHGDKVGTNLKTLQKLKQFYQYVSILTTAHFITNHTEIKALQDGQYYSLLSLVQCVS